jgi:hypothetical protein
VRDPGTHVASPDNTALRHRAHEVRFFFPRKAVMRSRFSWVSKSTACTTLSRAGWHRRLPGPPPRSRRAPSRPSPDLEHHFHRALTSLLGVLSLCWHDSILPGIRASKITGAVYSAPGPFVPDMAEVSIHRALQHDLRQPLQQPALPGRYRPAASARPASWRTRCSSIAAASSASAAGRNPAAISLVLSAGPAVVARSVISHWYSFPDGPSGRRVPEVTLLDLQPPRSRSSPEIPNSDAFTSVRMWLDA